MNYIVRKGLVKFPRLIEVPDFGEVPIDRNCRVIGNTELREFYGMDFRLLFPEYKVLSYGK